MCGKPTINGRPGYRWNGETPGDDSPANIHPVNPPALADGDEMLWDEPGRCGGIDSHSYHFRVVGLHGSWYLLVRHGGGDERIDLGGSRHHSRLGLERLDSDGRYWLLLAIYRIHSDAMRTARDNERDRWASAAVQKRIKVRKRGGRFRVEILPPAREVA